VFFGLKDEILWKMAHCSGTALVHQLRMQHMLFTSLGAVSKTLNNPVNYEFTLFLYTLGSDMSRIKKIFCVRHI
jgi:hypothetical protein